VVGDVTDTAGNGASADVVGGLVDARPDPATERFDSELVTAVSEGSLPPATTRSPHQVDVTTKRSRLIVAGLTHVTIDGEAPSP